MTKNKKAKKKYKRNYPKTVEEVLDDDMKYKRATLVAMSRFKKSRPFRGTNEEKQEKFIRLNSEFSKAYDIPPPTLVWPAQIGSSSAYFPVWNMIIMESYAVCTFLHEYGHALGFDERKTCKWSTNLFRRIFPRSFAKLEHRGHMLVTKDTAKKMDLAEAEAEVEKEKKDADKEAELFKTEIIQTTKGFFF